MTVEIKSPVRFLPSDRLATWYALAERYADPFWMIALALVAIEYSLHYSLFLQAIPHDTTFHIYAAQQILIGHPIYRDVAIIKAPLADLATVPAIVMARTIGLTDIMGARVLSLLVAAGTVSVTYLAGRMLWSSRAVGLIAGLVMAGWDFYGLRAVTGPEPKAFLILFAMPGLVLLARQRWFMAGLFAAMTTLAWQPGLMLAALAVAGGFVEPFLPASSASAPKRNPLVSQAHWTRGARQALRVVAGFLVPFAVVIVYLGLNDALSAAFNSTIGANLTHLKNTAAHTTLSELVRENADRIYTYGKQYCFSPLEYWLVSGGTLGFIGIGAAWLGSAARAKRLPVDLDRAPFILFTLGFAVFSLIDYNFCPDLFPLLPVIAIAVGWLVWMVARGLGALATRYSAMHAPPVETAAVTLGAALIAFVYLLDVRAYQVRGVNFADQMEVVATAREYLQPGDRMLAFGDSIVPIELHLTSVSKILHLGSKSGLGVLSSDPGGVQGMIDALDRDPPKLITLSRETKLAWTEPFYEWLDRRYQTVASFPRANIRFLLLKQ